METLTIDDFNRIIGYIDNANSYKELKDILSNVLDRYEDPNNYIANIIGAIKLKQFQLK